LENDKGYPIPPSLLNYNLLNLDVSPFNVEYRLTISFTGRQSCIYGVPCTGGYVDILVSYAEKNSQPVQLLFNRSVSCLLVGSIDWSFNNYSLFENDKPFTTENRVSNVSIRCGNTGCFSTDNPLNIENPIQFNIFLKATYECSGLNLGKPICISICNSKEGQEDCYQDYLDSCLLNPQFPGEFIFSNQPCIDFFSTYITDNGPRGDLDAALENACSPYDFTSLNIPSKDTPQSLINRRNVCACHLPEFQYVNYANELFTLYPGFKTIPGINQYCIVGACATSPFKSTNTGAVCDIPQCLDIATFNNNGTFNNSTVQINQTNSNCATVTGNSPSNGSNTRTIPTYVYVGVLLLVLVLLFIGTTLIYYG
jgi:hypothetical protein